MIEVLAFANENFKTVLASEGDTSAQGCGVLADGGRRLRAAGKLQACLALAVSGHAV